MSYYLYDVALSFAGEDRDYVRQVADQLRTNGIRVFYDEYERANLWGKELIEYLEDIYKNKSRFVIIFVSKSYLIKDWTNHERKSALNRAFENKQEYILPFRLDDTKLPGLHDSISYLPARNLPPDDICNIFLEKLGLKNVSAIQSSLFLYRIARRRYAKDLSGIGASLFGTRWNSVGSAVFITATNIALAALENMVHIPNQYGSLHDFVAVQYVIPSNVPIATVYEPDLPDDWNNIPYTKATQEIGDLWLNSKDSCILSVPSVVVKQERNYLLNPEHERFKDLKINKIDGWIFDPRLFR